MKTTNLVVGQSGGPTPVINTTLYGVVAEAINEGSIDTVYGMRNGIEGLLNQQLISLNHKFASVQQAADQSGAILGASRYALKEEELETILCNMERFNISLFCYIGGNGSSRTVLALHQHAVATGRDMKFIHIPKTVDNDLYGTDHTPGYGSAAKFLAHMVQSVGADLLSMKTFDQIKIVEVMGKNAGWLAAASALGKKEEFTAPHLVYLPERCISLEQLLTDVESAYHKYGVVLMIIPDHFRIAENQNLLDQDAVSSPQFRSGHPGGGSHFLARIINEQMGLKARYDAPGTFLRSARCCTSRTDLLEAYELGCEAVRFGVKGYSGGMVALNRVSSSPYLYRIDWIHLEGIAGKERTLPSDFWDSDRHMPTSSFIEYVMPLIDSEIPQVLTSL